MKQEILILNGIKIPYIIDDNGVEWYPMSWIHSKVLLKKSNNTSLLKNKKYENDVSKLSIDFSNLLNLHYENTQITNCMSRNGYFKYLDSMSLNNFSIDAMYNYNLLRRHFGLNEIYVKDIKDFGNEFMTDVLNSSVYSCMKVCVKCKRNLPANHSFFYKDDRASNDCGSICRECATKDGQFVHADEYLQHIYYKYGNEMYIKVKNSKIEDVFLMYANEEILELPQKHIVNKAEQLKIIKHLCDNGAVSKENLSIIYLKDVFFKNTVICPSIQEIYDLIYKDWKIRYYNYPNAVFIDMKYSDAKTILKNYIKENNIIIEDVYDYDYTGLFKNARILNCCRNNILDFIMYYYNNKYISYKFKGGHVNYYKEADKRILCFKQYIKTLGINYMKIPLVISKYRMQQHNITLYNLLRKYYNGSIYEWANECYPNRFKEEDFNLECIRSSFDSIEESDVDGILREYFKYKLIHNVSSDDYTIRILDDVRQPDWIILEDNKTWIVEYWGMYLKNPTSTNTEKYKILYDKKVEMYKNSVRNSHYYYLFLYPKDLKNNGLGIRNKIELMKNCNDRIIGLE